MTNYTAKHIKDMEAAFGGGFVKARAELGVTSFGMQVINMPPDYGDYPEHDHEKDGQEEVYLALAGGGWIDIEGERVELVKDIFVRVAGGVTRKVHSGSEGLRMLVVGGCPGKAYEIPEMTELSPA
jgi:mannose-6-phosphate isomerase-like protein (cupin superfamily)